MDRGHEPRPEPRRSGPHGHPYDGSNAGPQVHLGATLWSRGNVLVGFYGMWNGHPSDDRRLVWTNLGLVVSADGLHFREPIPDFAIVEATEVNWRQQPTGTDEAHFPALIQGQGFENVGDETLVWYSSWPEYDTTVFVSRVGHAIDLGGYSPSSTPTNGRTSSAHRSSPKATLHA